MIHVGDCLHVMAEMPVESVDSIVTDPPYGLSFMGKDWDHGIPGEPFWREALRIAKPGTHLLAFGGTRTFHRLTCALEDAGWEIRDCIMWVYGSGFPKSHNLKDEWQGWGTALKPAWEPIIVARKPLTGTVAENVQRYGTGAINVDGCRIDGQKPFCRNIPRKSWRIMEGRTDIAETTKQVYDERQGRWPANLIHDGSDEVVGLFPETGASPKPYRRNVSAGNNIYGKGMGNVDAGKLTVSPADSGSAARFFYCAKASKADRDEGVAGVAGVAGVGALRDNGRPSLPRKNHHPTVKPTDLMRYLCRLVTPPDGVVLDPFCGSGSTGKAATLEGFRFIGIELNPEYAEIARARIAAVEPDMPLMRAAT